MNGLTKQEVRAAVIAACDMLINAYRTSKPQQHTGGSPKMASHRTCLLVDTSEGFTGQFAERVNRLLQSVNGVNIKVDVYSFDGTAVSEGLPTPPEAESATTFEDAVEELSGQYVQVLTSRPGDKAKASSSRW